MRAAPLIAFSASLIVWCACAERKSSKKEPPAGSAAGSGSALSSGSGSGSALTARPGADDPRLQSATPVTSKASTLDETKHDSSPDLRKLDKGLRVLKKGIQPDSKPVKLELERIPRPKALAARAVSPPNAVLAADSPAPLVSFDGIGASIQGYAIAFYPPDTDGDIGESQYVQLVNASIAVFDRKGKRLLGPIPTKLIWGGFGGPCEATNDGDGTVLYDQLAKRWVIAQFTHSSKGFAQCVAISQTDDATGAYFRYQYDYSQFNDYPKMAQWGDAYLVTYNMFASAQLPTFIGSKVCALSRDALLKGEPAKQQCFDIPGWGGLLATDFDGNDAPSGPAYVFGLGVNALAYWELHLDWTNPTSSSLSGPQALDVAPFTELCGSSFSCVEQKGSSVALDSLSDRLMNRAAYRTLDDSVVLSHAVAVGAGGGARWYQIKNIHSSTPLVAQQGTYAPDASYRFITSVAMDKLGDIALGFAATGRTRFPSIAYALRTVSDPANALRRERTVVEGTAAQHADGGSRYGDYSSLRLDPLDDCTFWYTQQYPAATGKWNTRIVSFRADACGTH